MTAERHRVFFVARWALGGAAFGCLFVLVAWWIGASDMGGATFRELHNAMPIMWIVDLAPTVLGLVGAGIGILHSRLHDSHERTRDLAEEIAATWTSDLQRVNAELAQAIEEQERLYAAISHELRTPLTSILGYTELAEGIIVAPSEATSYISEIYKSASFLLQMVNELLEVAKLSRHGMGLDLVDTDACPTLEQVASLLRPLADSQGLELVTRFETRLPCRTDPVRLRQIVTNLIANAIKYSREGTIQLTTRIHQDRYVIEVIDEGPGLEREDLERIFRPFDQGKNGHRADSTGLGLAVSRSLAEAMDGALSAYSSGRGTGSTFRVTLPLATGAGVEHRQARLVSVEA